ncbi:MAG: glycine--tRNA ligase subunit alpha, partial [Alphaproteobacteria bacterium]
LDARGLLSVAQRAQFIARVRHLAKGCFETWMEGKAPHG